jgi:hypothetical protein
MTSRLMIFQNIDALETGAKLLISNVSANIETSKMSTDPVSPIIWELLCNTGLLPDYDVYGKSWLPLIKMSHSERLAG